MPEGKVSCSWHQSWMVMASSPLLRHSQIRYSILDLSIMIFYYHYRWVNEWISPLMIESVPPG